MRPEQPSILLLSCWPSCFLLYQISFLCLVTYGNCLLTIRSQLPQVSYCFHRCFSSWILFVLWCSLLVYHQTQSDLWIVVVPRSATFAQTMFTSCGVFCRLICVDALPFSFPVSQTVLYFIWHYYLRQRDISNWKLWRCFVYASHSWWHLLYSWYHWR